MRIPPTARFALACCLFAAWMGYLVYLAANKSKPVVLSRPQLLVSSIDIVAEVDALDEPVVVKEVLFPRNKNEKVAAGTKVSVANLKDCKRLARSGEDPEQVPLDWTGPGLYLLPLRQQGQGYVVTPIPLSPGFQHVHSRIYPATDEVRRQYQDIRGAP